MECPSCFSSSTEIIESRRCSNGSRRRRHRCNVCEHRWSVWYGSKPPAGGANRHEKRGKRQQHPREPLTEDQVRAILTAKDVSHREMGRRMGRSSSAIQQIRLGQTHAKVAPEIVRWNQAPKPAADTGESCYRCIHWEDRCTMGYPDPVQLGPVFAAECAVYTPGD